MVNVGNRVRVWGSVWVWVIGRVRVRVRVMVWVRVRVTVCKLCTVESIGSRQPRVRVRVTHSIPLTPK